MLINQICDNSSDNLVSNTQYAPASRANTWLTAHKLHAVHHTAAWLGKYFVFIKMLTLAILTTRHLQNITWQHWRSLWLGLVIGGSLLTTETAHAYCPYIGTADGAFCICDTAPFGMGSASGVWAVNHGSNDGSFLYSDEINVNYCTDSTDTVCTAARPASLTTGSTLYLKHGTDGTHYKCNITLGADMVSELYTPGAAPATPVGAAAGMWLLPFVFFVMAGVGGVLVRKRLG